MIRLREISKDGTPCAMKVARTVWSGGKLSDYFKELPITIKLMSTPAIVGSTLMYIFHRIEQSLTGAPTLIILDECWVFFDNEQFAQKIREWLKVLRKANASVVFATQSLTDIVESPIFSTVLESCPSQIFLPNDKALEESLKEKYFMFGLNQRQVV